MNDMPGWGPESQPPGPVPPPPTPPSAPGAPTVPGAPVYGGATAVPPPLQYPVQAPMSPPGYGAMAGPYGAPPYGGVIAPNPPGRGLQIAGLVLGIVSLIVFLSWIALVCGILGIIFGAVGRSKAKKVGAPTAMGTAGIICGAIGVVVIVGLIVLAIVYLSNNPSYFMVG